LEAVQVLLQPKDLARPEKSSIKMVKQVREKAVVTIHESFSLKVGSNSL
jgi:hypothetical protein